MPQCVRSLPPKALEPHLGDSTEYLGLGSQGLSLTLRMYSFEAGIGCLPSLPHLIGVDPAVCEVRGDWLIQGPGPGELQGVPQGQRLCDSEKGIRAGQ